MYTKTFHNLPGRCWFKKMILTVLSKARERFPKALTDHSSMEVFHNMVVHKNKLTENKNVNVYIRSMENVNSSNIKAAKSITKKN